MFVVQWLRGGRRIHRETMLGASVQDVIGAAKDMLPRIAHESGAWPDHIAIFDAAANRTVTVKAESSAAWTVWVALCFAAAVLSVATLVYFQRHGWPAWTFGIRNKTQTSLRVWLTMAAPLAFIFGMLAYILRNRSPRL
jgi:hypothetical protein